MICMKTNQLLRPNEAPHREIRADSNHGVLSCTFHLNKSLAE